MTLVTIGALTSLVGNYDKLFMQLKCMNNCWIFVALRGTAIKRKLSIYNFVYCLKIINTVLKNNLSILKQILWKTYEWH